MNPAESSSTDLTRRRFLGGTLAAAAASSLSPLPALAAEEKRSSAPEPRPEFKRKLKIGVVGNGGRGAWIAKLFQEHGGFELWAVADYFQPVADACGDALGVDKTRRFSTLSGYKKLIESGVEAVALQTPPYFMAEHARAAVEAGLHVYLAKPVAPDVSRALEIAAAAKTATSRQRCFFVDYQIPTDPVNIEVVKRIHAGALGKIVQMRTAGITRTRTDPPKTATLESRLKELVWLSDIAFGCDYIGNYDIHAIDAALWAIRQRPVAAMGGSRICRPDPHGDAHDVCSLVYEYADGTVHTHFGQALNNSSAGDISAEIYGTEASALLSYRSRAFVKGGKQHFGGGAVENLYLAGAERNIARFYRDVTENRFDNDTVPRAIDGVLTCVLGYEAGSRNLKVTMEQLLRENKRWELDLSGLKT